MELLSLKRVFLSVAVLFFAAGCVHTEGGAANSQMTPDFSHLSEVERSEMVQMPDGSWVYGEGTENDI